VVWKGDWVLLFPACIQEAAQERACEKGSPRREQPTQRQDLVLLRQTGLSWNWPVMQRPGHKKLLQAMADDFSLWNIHIPYVESTSSHRIKIWVRGSDK
jgi:hypothetical protein